MNVLIACEFSQVVCKAFRDKGHKAYSCDLLPTEGNPEWHIQDDVLNHLDEGWDLMIAHDPCTFQCNSGVRWLYEIPNRWVDLRLSCEFTRIILSAPIMKICRENPIPHRYALGLVGEDYTQIIHPHYFTGSDESKATCLWLKGLPVLERTQWLGKDMVKQSVWRMGPSEKRGQERSRFPLSIARAMADQWG